MQCYEKADPAFMLPAPNGCAHTFRSFTGGKPLAEEESLDQAEYLRFFNVQTWMPPDVIDWMKSLALWYEDEHAIYVHAGLPYTAEGGFLHPEKVKTKAAMLWCRDEHFFRNYAGKLVVFGHTKTELLPPELSSHTPEDPSDMWAGPCTIGLDTGCGKEGGFLTALELPAKRVYESR
jgi:serine/threonine protein phosphatase 1